MATHAHGASAPVLKFHRRKKQPHFQLPFVGHNHHPVGNFWDVPARGGYMGGCITGENLGLLYLHHLRLHGKQPLGHLYLQWIVIAWMEQAIVYGGGEMKEALPDESDELRSLRGQIVGFMKAITPWLMASVEQLGRNLESTDTAAVLAAANAGLSGEGRRRFEEACHAA